MIFLLDTSAILVFYRKEPEVDQVLALFDDPQHDILLSTRARFTALQPDAVGVAVPLNRP
jgi:hypothetical protein